VRFECHPKSGRGATLFFSEKWPLSMGLTMTDSTFNSQLEAPERVTTALATSLTATAVFKNVEAVSMIEQTSIEDRPSEFAERPTTS
jgi:hypothetical protein